MPLSKIELYRSPAFRDAVAIAVIDEAKSKIKTLGVTNTAGSTDDDKKRLGLAYQCLDGGYNSGIIDNFCISCASEYDVATDPAEDVSGFNASKFVKKAWDGVCKVGRNPNVL